MFKYVALCSNLECTFKEEYTQFDEAPKFCTKCGKPMVSECPNCKAKFEKEPIQFCSKCGTKVR